MDIVDIDDIETDTEAAAAETPAAPAQDVQAEAGGAELAACMEDPYLFDAGDVAVEGEPPLELSSNPQVSAVSAAEEGGKAKGDSSSEYTSDSDEDEGLADVFAVAAKACQSGEGTPDGKG